MASELGAAPEMGLDDYRVLGLRDVLRQLGPDHPRRSELVGAAASDDRSIAGRATAWREPLSNAATPDGEALRQVADRRAVTLYRQAASAGLADAHDPSVEAALAARGGGEPLPSQLRIEMEHELGISLANVRIHTDAIAARAALALGADAFTVGEDIFFAQGAFAPDTAEGRKLIVHELTHVAQAARGETGPSSGGLRVSQPGDHLERKAQEAAEKQSGQRRPSLQLGGPTTQRQEAGAHQTEPLGIMRATKAAAAANSDAKPDDDKLTTALTMSLEYLPAEAAAQLKALLADPMFKASILIGLITYMALWVAPEPVFTKAAAILTTITIMTVVGVAASQIIAVARAFLRLRSACEAAQTPDELRNAAREFAHTLGAAGVNLLVSIGMLLGGKALPGRPPGGPSGLGPKPALAGAGGTVSGSATATATAANAGSAISISPNGQIVYMTVKADGEAGGGKEPTDKTDTAKGQEGSSSASKTSAAAKRITADDVTKGMEIDPTQVQVFRGGIGFKLKPGEVKIDKATGLVQPTHGPSLDIVPETVEKFGGAHRLTRVPPELKVIQRGRIEHFEIVPREPMTEARFQELLNTVEQE